MAQYFRERKKHLGNKYHQEAFEQATNICRRFEDPQHTLLLLSNETLKTRHQTYLYIIETLARIIHLMGKQGLAFRGTHENIGESAQKRNPGNFLAIAQEIAHHNLALRDYIEAPFRKDVNFLRLKTQNELIEIIGTKCIQERLVKEMRAAKYHSILVDEVTSSNQEFLSVVARHLNEEKDIREVFLDF